MMMMMMPTIMKFQRISKYNTLSQNYKWILDNKSKTDFS